MCEGKGKVIMPYDHRPSPYPSGKYYRCNVCHRYLRRTEKEYSVVWRHTDKKW